MDVSVVLASEINQKCANYFKIEDQIRDASIKLDDLKRSHEQNKEKMEMLNVLAELRGENYNSQEDDEDVEKLEKERTDLNNTHSDLDQQILIGLKEINLNVSNEIVIENNKSIIKFDNETYENLIHYLNIKLNKEIIKIDDIEFNYNNLIIDDVENIKEAVIKLKTFKPNIQRLSKNLLNEEDKEVEHVVEYLHNSSYSDIWEKIGGRQLIILEKFYEELLPSEQDIKKRVQNFFTNSKTVLKDSYPFIRLNNGEYILNFLGTLVWNRYVIKYKILVTKNGEKAIDKELMYAKKDETSNSKIEPLKLNGFLDNETKKTLYGDKVI